MAEARGVTEERLITAREAAELLGVSAAYLRNSDCPKFLLPSGRGERPMIRYRRSDVELWIKQWEAKATHPQRRVRRIA